MKKFSLEELISKANNNTNTIVVSTGATKYSLGIVNNINGKRISISKALSTALALNDTACFLPVEEENQLLISAAPIGDRSSLSSLSGADKKISYNAALVQMLTNCFKLDFSDKTSSSFNDIYIDNSTGTPVAVVSMNSQDT